MLHEYASARASCDRPVLPSMQPLRAAPGAGARVLPRIRDCHLGAEKQHRQRLYTGSQFRDAWVLALRFRFDAPTGSGAEKIASSSCAPRRTAKNRAKDKGTSVSVPLARASGEPTAYLQRASLPATGESDISMSRRDGARTCVSTQKKYHTAVSYSPVRPTDHQHHGTFGCGQGTHKGIPADEHKHVSPLQEEAVRQRGPCTTLWQRQPTPMRPYAMLPARTRASAQRTTPRPRTGATHGVQNRLMNDVQPMIWRGLRADRQHIPAGGSRGRKGARRS